MTSVIHRSPWTTGMVISFVLLGCGSQKTSAPAKEYVGNMNDFTYSGQVRPDGVTTRTSASGKSVSIDQFKGRFIWVEYAAPWCETCLAEAQEIKGMNNLGGTNLVFLTIMTSKST